MRNGITYTYRFVRVFDRGTPIAVVGTGGPQPILPSSGPGRPRSMVIAEGDTFAFYAARPNADLLRLLARFDGDLAKFVDGKLFNFKTSRIFDSVFRMTPTWPACAEIESLFAREVLCKAPDAFKHVEPPAVWAREFPVLHAFSLKGPSNA